MFRMVGAIYSPLSSFLLYVVDRNAFATCMNLHYDVTVENGVVAILQAALVDQGRRRL